MSKDYYEILERKSKSPSINKTKRNPALGRIPFLTSDYASSSTSTTLSSIVLSCNHLSIALSTQ